MNRYNEVIEFGIHLKCWKTRGRAPATKRESAFYFLGKAFQELGFSGRALSSICCGNFRPVKTILRLGRNRVQLGGFASPEALLAGHGSKSPEFPQGFLCPRFSFSLAGFPSPVLAPADH
jgi:hypothetical protein